MLKSSSLCLYSSNLGTFWLKIEQFWPFEEISILSNGGHLGYRTALTDTILKGDHPRIISAEFGWPFEEIGLSNGGHLGYRTALTDYNFERGPPKDHFSRVWLRFSVVSEERIILKFHPPFFLICIIGQNRQKFKVHKKSRNIC